MIADVVIPTPGIQLTAWIALAAGVSWLILFLNVIRREVRQNPVTEGYKGIAFLCLFSYFVLSLIVVFGVILSDSAS